MDRFRLDAVVKAISGANSWETIAFANLGRHPGYDGLPPCVAVEIACNTLREAGLYSLAREVPLMNYQQQTI